MSNIMQSFMKIVRAVSEKNGSLIIINKEINDENISSIINKME